MLATNQRIFLVLDARPSVNFPLISFPASYHFLYLTLLSFHFLFVMTNRKGGYPCILLLSHCFFKRFFFRESCFRVMGRLLTRQLLVFVRNWLSHFLIRLQCFLKCFKITQ